MSSPRLEPADARELREAILDLPRLACLGGGTKPALAGADPGIPGLSTRALRGIVAYHPLDFTLTARAGTPLNDIREVLAERGQCLPFDPPGPAAGATLGGCVAAGLDGPCGMNWGCLRDHVLALRFCDGRGRLLRGGAPVLRNAAGPDLPRFLTGSLGRLAVITEVTVRTRPSPREAFTLAWPAPSLAQAMLTLQDLALSAEEFDALDLEVREPEGPGCTVWARLEGRPASLTARARRILAAGPRGGAAVPPEEAEAVWEARRRLAWVPGDHAVVVVPLGATALPEFDHAVASFGARRHYSRAGRFAWIAHPQPALLESVLRERHAKGLLVRGQIPSAAGSFLGHWPASPLARRLKALFDPQDKFPPWPEAAP